MLFWFALIGCGDDDTGDDDSSGSDGARASNGADGSGDSALTDACNRLVAASVTCEPAFQAPEGFCAGFTNAVINARESAGCRAAMTDIFNCHAERL
ncbi:MAG: hypothetical protein AAGA56_23900 [Myxococcota bacterium]